MAENESKVLLDVPARCHMNEVANMGEGGRLVIHAVDQVVRDKDLRQVEAIINARTDAAMEPYPATKTDMARRRLRIVIYDEGEYTAEEMVELGLTGGD